LISLTTVISRRARFWIVARTCFCIWLFSSALSGFDRRKLSLPEIMVRFAAAFCCLALSPMIHLPAIAIGLALVAYDLHAARPKAQPSKAQTSKISS
jgi:hypothetical protein